MDMAGEYRIAAPQQTVWDRLNDPETLRQCIPGCDEIEKRSDTEFAARVTARVGPVKARFAGAVTLSELDPPRAYTIAGEGQGAAAGFARGSARVTLDPDGDGATTLRYRVHATVGGKLAQLGARLIDATARKMADDFFARFGELVGTPEPEPAAEAAIPAGAAELPPAEPPPPVAMPEPAPPAATETETKGLPPLLWISGLIAIVIVLILAFR